MSTESGDHPTRKVSRRKFIRSSTGLLTAVAGAWTAGRTIGTDEVGLNPSAKRLAMVIDTDRCIGCKACTVACKAENGVRLGGFRSWVSEREVGAFPQVTRHFLPRLCNHCQEPACLKVCPVAATYKRVDGLVDVDKKKCIGCRYCMVACPYGVRHFNPSRDSEDELFPARTPGTVDKCNFCAHRVDNGVVPACVNTCPANARVFGDLNDPQSEVSRMCASEGVVPLLPGFRTKPSVYYKGVPPELLEGTDPELRKGPTLRPLERQT